MKLKVNEKLFIQNFENVGLVAKNLYQFREITDGKALIIFIADDHYIWVGKLHDRTLSYENVNITDLPDHVLIKLRDYYDPYEYIEDFHTFTSHIKSLVLKWTLGKFNKIESEG